LDTNLFDEIKIMQAQSAIACVLIDEAQFLTKIQVKQLTDIVDELQIPVLAYGIRTDFLGQTFSGSAALLAWADKLVELKTICHCGRKANFVIRLNSDGNAAIGGVQVEVGGNERYQALCRKHFKKSITLQ
jgi:thymidine kinase